MWPPICDGIVAASPRPPATTAPGTRDVCQMIAVARRREAQLVYSVARAVEVTRVTRRRLHQAVRPRGGQVIHRHAGAGYASIGAHVTGAPVGGVGPGELIGPTSCRCEQVLV